MVNPNRKDWSLKLINALWAYHTTFESPLGMSPYRIVYGKACHLPVELEHKSYWTVKIMNFALDKASTFRKIQLNELEEIRRDVYQNNRIYKEKIKFLHDQYILRKSFLSNQKVLLYDSRLWLFLKKLKSK